MFTGVKISTGFIDSHVKKERILIHCAQSVSIGSFLERGAIS
jgi:predicted protein tyrosine phosphatase